MRDTQTSRSPRLAPLERPLTVDQSRAVDHLGIPYAIGRVFARNPDLVDAIVAWSRYFLTRRSRLSLRHRELLIMRTTSRCGADYEWGLHVREFADRVGLSADQVRSLAAGSADDDCWSDKGDCAIVEAVDQLCRTSDIDDQAWDALCAAVGQSGALDVLLGVGWYQGVSYVSRVARLERESCAPSIAESASGARAVGAARKSNDRSPR